MEIPLVKELQNFSRSDLEQHLILESVLGGWNYRSRVWKTVFSHSVCFCRSKIDAYGYFLGSGGGNRLGDEIIYTSLNFLVLKTHT